LIRKKPGKPCKQTENNCTTLTNSLPDLTRTESRIYTNIMDLTVRYNFNRANCTLIHYEVI
ncbi:MAG: hypothetical protein WAW16_05770, partial [Candidatus Cryosericum sp.]